MNWMRTLAYSSIYPSASSPWFNTSGCTTHTHHHNIPAHNTISLFHYTAACTNTYSHHDTHLLKRLLLHLLPLLHDLRLDAHHERVQWVHFVLIATTIILLRKSTAMRVTVVSRDVVVVEIVLHRARLAPRAAQVLALELHVGSQKGNVARQAFDSVKQTLYTH